MPRRRLISLAQEELLRILRYNLCLIFHPLFYFSEPFIVLRYLFSRPKVDRLNFFKTCHQIQLKIENEKVGVGTSISAQLSRPVESYTAEPKETFLPGPSNIFTGFLWENFFEFFLKMVHSGVLNISGRRRGPKRRGARGSLPPYPTLSTGLAVRLNQVHLLC